MMHEPQTLSFEPSEPAPPPAPPVADPADGPTTQATAEAAAEAADEFKDEPTAPGYYQFSRPNVARLVRTGARRVLERHGLRVVVIDHEVPVHSQAGAERNRLTLYRVE